MNFIVTERNDKNESALLGIGGITLEAAALPGAPVE